MSSPEELYITFEKPQEIVAYVVTPDNDSLFKAVSLAFYSTEEFHKTISTITMTALKEAKLNIPYEVMNNDEIDVWSTEFGKTITNSIAKVLACRLIIYDYNIQNKSIDKYVFGDRGYAVKIIRKGHKLYEVLTLRTKETTSVCL